MTALEDRRPAAPGRLLPTNDWRQHPDHDPNWADYVFFGSKPATSAAFRRNKLVGNFPCPYEVTAMQNSTLRPSSWLAKRLGLSLSTIERLRAAGSSDLPSAILIGRSIRYDETLVEQWLLDRMQAPSASVASIQSGGHNGLVA